jgi:hypothetical protein
MDLVEETLAFDPPYVRTWGHEVNPLPVRMVRAGRRGGAHPLGVDAPPWYDTGMIGLPFDFCGHVRRLCADIVARCETFWHSDVSRLLFAVTQARNTRAHGLQARVTPLRFRNGHLTRRGGRGTSYQVQRYFVGAQEMLYVVTFCLPRFLDQDFDDKFITIFHELYHISPSFDGDLRRHEGRCTIHSRSKRGYDAHMADLARDYLAKGADPALHGFLRLNFTQLQHRHGKVLGAVVPRPKLIPVPARRKSQS